MAEQSINDIIADELIAWGNEKLSKAKGILTATGSTTSTNVLYNSLMVTPVAIKGNNLSIGIGFSTGKNGEDSSTYYKYIDEGVRGLGGGKTVKPSTGRFKFKTKSVSKGMVDSIQKWIAQKPILIRKDKKESKVPVIKRANNIAFAIAKNIKKTGIGKTMFWSDTFNDDAYKELADRIAKRLGGDFTIQIKGL